LSPPTRGTSTTLPWLGCCTVRCSGAPCVRARRLLTRSTFEALVAALPAYLQDFTRFAYQTGWRRGEIESLTAANVDMKLGELRIGDSKNGDGRVIPLRDEDGRLNAVGEIVERRMAARQIKEKDGSVRVVDLLFHRRGHPVGDFRKVWRAACVKAGCARQKIDLNGRPMVDRKGRPIMVATNLFHDLRRTFAHDAAESGLDYKTIMEWTGHRTTSTFLRYRITSLAGMRRAAARVATFRDAQASTPATVVPIASRGVR
jgi:integrase